MKQAVRCVGDRAATFGEFAIRVEFFSPLSFFPLFSSKRKKKAGKLVARDSFSTSPFGESDRVSLGDTT